MSDHIPFDIQSQIMKKLPVKSLIQFRSVSKQWKSFIDDHIFIKNYHVNHANPQHHLLLRYKLDDNVESYTSIIDDNTFPKQKFPLTAPESLSLFRKTMALSSVDGLVCFHGDLDSKTEMAIIWNPTIRKSVGIVIHRPKLEYIVVGFGVCPDTSDPTLVKISVDGTRNMWEVEVFTLSTRVWKTVYTGAPFKSCTFSPGQVFVDGVDMTVCGVWTREDGANKPFTKIYTVRVEGRSLYRVLWIRNNGEVVMELDDNNNEESEIEVYEPLSGHTDSVGIRGKRHTFYARSYMETLLLLDHSDSIIY